MRPDLSIVIVNWNTKNLLRDCLASVFQSAGDIALEVFVVDNRSSDGSGEMVRCEFPAVRLIENESNVGFAVANNQAFPLCSADLVMLLNPDTRVRDGALQTLVQFMRAHPEAGAAGPLVVHPAGRLRVMSCGHQPTLRTLFNHYSGLSALLPHSPAFRGLFLLIGPHSDRVRPVEWISGACLLVRRRVIDEVGPLSERWFMYAEDWEWCHRISAAGWTLYSVPEAVVEHHLGAASAKNKPVSTMCFDSMRSYYVSKERPSWLQLLVYDVILTGGVATRAVFYALRALVDRGRRDLWRIEADKFVAYTLASLRLAWGRQEKGQTPQV
jgi:GT2 family glycosyltransferase